MKISLNIYMEAINGLHIENEPGQTSRSFSAVELLENGTRSLCAEILYVCPLSLAVRLAAENADAAFIALRDRFRPDEIVPENIIIVSDDLTLTQLFMRLYRRQSLLCEWQSSMYDCIIRGMPIVGLLLSSEPVIGNFISLSDSALALIAYTSNIPIDDPVSCRLIENGYHDEQSVEIFKRAERFKRWNGSGDDLIYDMSNSTSKYPVVSKVFSDGGAYFTHVVMICNRHPISPALIDKFNILIDALQLYLVRHGAERTAPLGALLNSVLDDQRPAQDADALLLWPEQAQGEKKSFRLLSLQPKKSGSEPSGTISHAVSAALPGAAVSVYRQALLVMLFSTEKEAAGVLDGALEKLKPLLVQRDFCCGVSRAFSGLEELREAYGQAADAVSYGLRLTNYSPLPEFQGPFFRYEDVYAHMLLAEPNNSSVLLSGEPYRKLCAIREADRAKGGNNYELLYTYITTGCHAGHTAEKMFMSRNNAAYRIDRLEESYGLHLDDYLTRLGLAMTFEMLNMNPAL